jgi:hypothetical protein
MIIMTPAHAARPAVSAASALNMMPVPVTPVPKAGPDPARGPYFPKPLT